jgi:hypothetical protein
VITIVQAQQHPGDAVQQRRLVALLAHGTTCRTTGRRAFVAMQTQRAYRSSAAWFAKKELIMDSMPFLDYP